jgi:hypothetical protein
MFRNKYLLLPPKKLGRRRIPPCSHPPTHAGERLLTRAQCSCPFSSPGTHNFRPDHHIFKRKYHEIDIVLKAYIIKLNQYFLFVR